MPQPSPAIATHHVGQQANIIDTVQSLIVAFVLAMTFRGFVTEGFVIPTGSMAPTLLGQHVLIHSDQTGITFAGGADQIDGQRVNSARVVDPMLGPGFPGSGPSKVSSGKRMGDRILVLKCLYPFSQPKRFDVVVFKNPTDPIGEAANYIKRLVGLPNEQVWLTDGDVFAKPLNGDEFRIQRKPEHVQRAVWQIVHNSDYIPMNPGRLDQPYPGPPWVGGDWDTSGRRYRCNTAQPTVLTWDRRSLNDWTAYNMLAPAPNPVPLSDLRVSTGIIADQPGLKTTLEIESRSHLFQFTLVNTGPGRGEATLRMVALRTDVLAEQVVGPVPVSWPAPGNVVNVEFWHVDQSMTLFINGKRVMDPLNYDWPPLLRLQNTTGDLNAPDVDSLLTMSPQPPQVRWRFEGSPVTLCRVQMDRDLYYRPAMLEPRGNLPHILGHAFATHPTDNPGILGPDQFMMCGDNSQMSLDSRLWGSPHPLIASQIDSAPFVVNRNLLLGKAWVVYFPAPYSLTEDGVPIIPDFGRLRFIR